MMEDYIFAVIYKKRFSNGENENLK